MSTLIATAVIRDRRRGEIHDGAWLVDLDGRRAAPLPEAAAAGVNRPGKRWEGGLRGIAFDDDRVFIAARDELLVFSPGFEPLGSYRSPYLKHCQGLSVFRRRLFLVSAGYDSVLGFDLDRMRFRLGLHIVSDGNDFRAMPFDPGGQKGPQLKTVLQLNHVHCDEDGLFISGQQTNGLLSYGGRRIIRYATLPRGVHDARPWRGGVLFNDSEAGVVRYVTPQRNHVFHAPRHPAELERRADSDEGRPPLALLRGLCTLEGRFIASGSSPATITLHDVETMKTTLAINLSSDVRSAIYGLEVWPFPTVDNS